MNCLGLCAAAKVALFNGVEDAFGEGTKGTGPAELEAPPVDEEAAAASSEERGDNLTFAFAAPRATVGAFGGRTSPGAKGLRLAC